MQTHLPVPPLGTSGVDLTAVGFGAWAAGGGGWAFGWGPQDDDASLGAMRGALDLGVNWIDTAAVYGLGHSEVLAVRLVRERSPSERPLRFTKGSPEFQPPRLAGNLAWPGVSGAIVGARAGRQVEGWIDAATPRLVVADLEEIADALRRTGAGTGPARPPAAGVGNA